jgi:phosphoribosylanthranilate isomerase
MTKVKICGIRRVEDALVAVESGADFLGFVFYERSRRALRPQAAREIIAAAREKSSARMVGVFVNAEPSAINEIARSAGLDYAQLSGDEPDDIARTLDIPAIQVVHVRPEQSESALAERVHRSAAELVLLDTPSSEYGGTGQTFDWSRIPTLDRPFVLAGGLHAGNVALAIEQVDPWGVDVSSGVETAGKKDEARIRAFIAAARGVTGTQIDSEREQ